MSCAALDKLTLAGGSNLYENFMAPMRIIWIEGGEIAVAGKKKKKKIVPKMKESGWC